LQPFT